MFVHILGDMMTPKFLFEISWHLKNVEHALCEYDKYFRFAIEEPTRGRTYKSRGHLDKQSQCEACSKNCDENSSIKCVLCNVASNDCCQKNEARLSNDGSWLCTVCHKIETAWSTEDSEFREDDPNGEEKTAASIRYQDKKKGKKTKKSTKALNFSACEPSFNLNCNFKLPSMYNCIVKIERTAYNLSASERAVLQPIVCDLISDMNLPSSSNDDKESNSFANCPLCEHSCLPIMLRKHLIGAHIEELKLEEINMISEEAINVD